MHLGGVHRENINRPATPCASQARPALRFQKGNRLVLIDEPASQQRALPDNMNGAPHGTKAAWLCPPSRDKCPATLARGHDRATAPVCIARAAARNLSHVPLDCNAMTLIVARQPIAGRNQAAADDAVAIRSDEAHS